MLRFGGAANLTSSQGRPTYGYMQMYFDSDRQMRSVVVRDRQADGSLSMVRVTADFNTRKQYTLYIMNSTIKCEIADILASEPGLDNCVPANGTLVGSRTMGSGSKTS
ncbi:hypothetical protein ScPMuIL_004179 [Solemya velum]